MTFVKHHVRKPYTKPTLTPLEKCAAVGCMGEAKLVATARDMKLHICVDCACKLVRFANDTDLRVDIRAIAKGARDA